MTRLDQSRCGPGRAAWTLALVLAVAGGVSGVRAQTGQAGGPVDPLDSLLEAAERAYAAADGAAAERGYAAVLALDPEHTRALFRLAQLRRDRPAEAASLLERYVALVPLDPWGHLALATAYARAGRRAEALRTYDAALALEPGDRDIALGGPRLLAQLGLADRAIEAYTAWLARHAEDGEAWRELSEQLQRARRDRPAARALERAIQAAPGDRRLAARLEALRTRMAPAVELGLLTIGETDVASLGGSAAVEAAAGDAGRVGVAFAQRRLSSFGEIGYSRRLLARGWFAPRADVQVQLAGGLVWTRLQQAADGATPEVARTRPEAMLRLRRRPILGGLTLDVRALHGPIDVTPRLAIDELTRTQASAALEVPAGDRLRVRGLGRVAAMTRTGERNIGTRAGGGLAFVTAPGVHLSGVWSQFRYRQAAPGYFSPRLAEAIEGGIDLDREHGPVSVAVDVAAGVQRIQRHGQDMGAWGPSLRAWGMLSWTVRPGRQLALECEGYNSRIAESVTPAEDWRYLSLTASFRMALR